MFIKKIILLVLFLILYSCSENNINIPQQKTPDIPLEYNFKLTDKNTAFKFGIWMFKHKGHNKNSIANWISVQHLGKDVLEPINVLWLDFKAKSKEESTNNVIKFLELNNFIMRSGSSVGYFSFFEDFEWVPQYKATWSDKLNPNTINNHGRTFLSHQINDNLGKSFFVSSGAFSIEDEKHLFISFKDALNQFKEVEDWSIYLENLDAGNIIKFENYDTFDHEGIKVFILN